MKKTIPYTIKLIIDNKSADVEYATCKCPAGTGPKGSCKHIAAMCYALEDFILVNVDFESMCHAHLSVT